MTSVLLKDARIFDGLSEHCLEGMQVLIECGVIREVSDKPINPGNARVIDVGGRTLMPGLIDAHIHAYASDVNVQKVDLAGEPYRTAHAARMLGFALDCGFTTVRDIGGGDYSLWRAIEDQTDSSAAILVRRQDHLDDRRPWRFPSDEWSRHTHGYCSCGDFNTLCVIADGVDECIKATREELRRGAHCIKIMGSGGVASPTDPIWMNQYREDEIRAIVNETTERRTYTSAHCHPADAVRRCVEFGVRVIEHGTLIDDATAKFVASRGAFIVPTMVIIFALVELGKELGFAPQSQEKAEFAFRQAICRHGVDAQGGREAWLRDGSSRERPMCCSAANSRSASRCSRRSRSCARPPQPTRRCSCKKANWAASHPALTRIFWSWTGIH